MRIDLQQIMEDWSRFGTGLKEAEFTISLREIRQVHLRHKIISHEDPSELRQDLNKTIKAAHGWLMLTDRLLHLPSAEPLPSATPLQGEWHAEGSSWQLRYIGPGPERGWRLHQYTVSAPDDAKPATHLAEPITHLRAGGQLSYLKLWALEQDRNNEFAPTPALAVLTGYGGKNERIESSV